MRMWWVGLLILSVTTVVFGQAEGTVESVGLQGYYRAECWVPMTVALRPTSDSPAELQIRVVQEDLDRDRVVAVRNVTVTPDLNGRSSEPQRFWMYFRAQPTDKGLQDAAIGGSPRTLEQQLKVSLSTTGGRTVGTLPVTQQGLKRLDVGPSQQCEDFRSVRFVLCVSDGASSPSVNEYQQTDGLSEPPVFVVIGPKDLPEDVRGYEMVDAILWMGAGAPDPRRSTEEPRYRAIEQYVRQGGMLVVCQGLDSAKTKGFEGLLPVRVNGYRESDDLSPLVEMGRLEVGKLGAEAIATRRVALAEAKSGAVVVRQKTWGGEVSPFLVRGRFGAGCVTWVAQDLGDGTIVRSLRKGWVRIWDEVLGWRNTPAPVKAGDLKDEKTTAYGVSRGSNDLGKSFERGGNLGMTASGYVLVAVLFFAVYWVVAGPGLYAWLSIRKMATLNWFMFGMAAVGAAMLAAVVVKVIQARSPSMEHVTLIRAAAGEYATVQSRIGLYVPSDGMKELKITGMAANTTNWITPYPEHPIRLADMSSKFLAMKQYLMPVVDASNEEPITVSMPWRSTMKRLQVKWNGEMAQRVTGDVRLYGKLSPVLSGTITNGTPWVLKDVYLVYRSVVPDGGDGSNAKGDYVVYMPGMNPGERIDLDSAQTGGKARRIGSNQQLMESTPGNGNVVYGGIELANVGWGNEVPLGDGWVGYWYSRDAMKRMEFGMAAVDDSVEGYGLSLPLCSLFDRVPPMRNQRDSKGGYNETRREVVRLGARYLNVSAAVAAGNLVVLAHAKGELPIPFTVDGSVPKGEGTILCQYILPLGRGSSVNVEK